MIGNRRLRASRLVLVGLLLLGFIATDPGSRPNVDPAHGRLDAVVAAGPAVWSGPAAGLATRLQGDTGSRPGARTSRPGLTSSPSPDQFSGPSVPRTAALLERAAHPERLGGILLRGPPGLSA
jgi:hypothetical protein